MNGSQPPGTTWVVAVHVEMSNVPSAVPAFDV